ncbi:MAG: single-stranded DNA-binding protein [Chloroherpetonaceae bacterium]|nr:single-stranded DNA-binding protein [Chloroherpetonaceae bacterium]
MARDLNKVMLIGRLGADPETRVTPSGSTVVNFNIATGDSYKDKNGQTVEKTEWHRIVVWDKLAEICKQYLTKGKQVYIEGKLQTRSWDDKETGKKNYMTEIVCTDMQMLGGMGGSSQRESSSMSSPDEGFSKSSSKPKFNPDDVPLAPDKDDLPF